MTEAPRLRRARIAASASFAAYVAVIVGANWMIGHVGTPIPGAHVLPVGFGLEAPSGVYLAALAFVARDVLQRVGGARAGVAAILVGAGISAFVASAHLALASGATFLLSETCDFLIYTPLQKRNFPLAVVASGVVGDLVDSTVFLTLAGIPLAVALPGQLLGKLWVMLLGGLLAAWLRRFPLFATPARSLSVSATPA
ncbi:MAG: VUT family protein [Actinomycetota bacterium]|nr:VUT family protein [Actinomycetota bacterium]MDA8396319.1 VUT family protein [Actinomycetota bacterium]